MKEILNADKFEVSMETILNALILQFGKNGISYVSEKVELEMQLLSSCIESLVRFDDELKMRLIDNLSNIIYDSTNDAFENGLRIGLSVLKNLFTAEIPVIKTVSAEISVLERRCKSVDETNDLNTVITEYITKVIPMLEDSQKIELQGRVEAILHKNITDKYNLN